jgi:signal peptidase II
VVIGVIALLIAADQLTKYLVIAYIDPADPVSVVPGFFQLVYVRNPGAAWGILGGRTGLLAVISGVVFVLMFVNYRRFAEGWAERGFAITLLLGGIAGNFIDRMWRDGGVVDFLRVYYGSWEWPSFNVADSAICIGMGIYFLSSFIRPEPGKEEDEVGSDQPAAE